MESKLRILISDDDKEFCARCTSILRGCGFETTVAAVGSKQPLRQGMDS